MRRVLRLLSRLPLGAALMVMLLGFHAEARAQAPVEGELVWYGYQSLIADVVLASAVLVLDPAFVVPLAGVGPTVHGVHGNYLAMSLSFSLRFTALILYGAGALQRAGDALNDACDLEFNEEPPENCADPDDDGRELIGVGLFGLALGIVVDAVIGFERVPVERPQASWNIRPWLDPVQRGGGLGVAGAF